MLITERRLRQIIRKAIKESSELYSMFEEDWREKNRSIIRKWLFDEVMDGKELREYAEYDLMEKIAEHYAKRNFKDGTPIDLSDDIDYLCDKVMDVLHDYHKGEEGNWKNDFQYLNTYDISMENIETVTNKLTSVIEKTVYVEIGQMPSSLEDENDELSIEEKILNALRDDMNEEEYERIKANIPKIIDYVKEDFEQSLERGYSFEETYEQAKNYLESFYKFD